MSGRGQYISHFFVTNEANGDRGKRPKENPAREANAVFRKLQPTFGPSEAAV
jgi:hypothetical protein